MSRAGLRRSTRDRDMSKARTTALLLVGAAVAFVSVTATGAPKVPARTPRLAQRIAAVLARPAVRLRAVSAELRVLPRTAPAHRVPSRVLRVGAVNQRLFNLHFLPGPGSSEYTTATVDAVIAFQKWAGITRDGTAGPQTQKALAQAAAPTPLLQRAGRRVEVSISKQLALEVSGGKVLWVLPVSTAMPGYVTPLGRYRVYSKSVESWSNRYKEWLPDASYYAGGRALHGLASVPPFPASHGCIRVPLQFAPLLYKFDTVGTEIDVLA
jgi:lipoprotein-anchoring transpeptidase ErfK/SrfK